MTREKDKKLPEVSVIIPVKDDSERLRECLKCVCVQTYPKEFVEVIVVDNGSKEDVGSLASLFPGVICIKEKAPGPAAARNKGISCARGDVFAFTDSDCRPDPGWLENGVRALSALEGPGMAAGRIDFTYCVPDKPSLVELYDTTTYFSQKRYIEKYHFGATANLFVSKKIIDDIGFFDSVSFKGAAGEDPDWGRRVFEAGYPQVYAENAVIKHPAVSTLRALWRKTKRITRGNVALSNKYKNKCAKGAAGYLGFLYKAIWADDRDKGILQKICLTFIALTVVMVKLRVRLTI